MNEIEARLVVIEDALQQAIWTTQFMHGCLTGKGYTYAYPEQTERHLAQWCELLPQRELCVHSFEADGCESCEQRVLHHQRLAEARDALSRTEKT